ncbi:EscU/YscU/HrcU family type III secretion system export apparatus switch protein [Kozakia baliensis]|uniref:EscU/YscU/HrcU family type III secretion system export apparatus switch protein n=1 Tax=Kozakia baliensis TaxID=153496 RepID=UPI00049608A8|nr:flagellar type III secretion system protein FlhB [Kozakia baliensis]
MADSEDRTEAPSQRRLDQAREEGNVSLSREALSAAALAAGVLMIPKLISNVRHSFYILRGMMWHAGDQPLSSINTARILTIVLRTILSVFLPFGSMILAAILACGLMQTGFLLRPAGMAPDFKRISPLSGISRLFSASALVELLKSVAKCVVFVAIAFVLGRSFLQQGPMLVGLNPIKLTEAFSLSVKHLGMAFIGAQILIAGADIFWNRTKRLSKLKMSRQELKEEYRQTEGDPHVKGKLRQIRAKLSRQRMMNAVKGATVVVTNPTHYAVALLYEKGKAGAPKIVAKGMDEVAARIREVACENRVPIMPNPPLARALYNLPLDTEIPVEHFKLVASIIAYVWKLKQPAPLPLRQDG